MRSIVTLSLCLLTIMASAQESPYQKFGKITVEELQKKVYSLDSNANAVVLSDIGRSEITGNTKGWFSVVTSHHKVAHILNKNGYNIADVEIPLYTNNDAEEKIQDLKAVTYNLENGKIVQTKLDRGNVFKEKKSSNLVIQKFTLPNVKEGCIVEYEYKVMSDFIEHLDPWVFQGSYPRLWSEFTLSVPSFFTYNFLSHGYLPITISDKKERAANFNLSIPKGTQANENVSISTGVVDYRWVMKDVAELKEESFTSTIENHVSKLEFDLRSQSDPLQPHDYRTTWPETTKELLQAKYFGEKLNANNGWLSDEMKAVTGVGSSNLDKMRNIYNYVRDNFSCTDHRSLYADQPLKTVFKTRKGSVAEINLLMTAMLRYVGIASDPVILSTRDNGYAYDFFPLLTRYNYVISKAMVDSTTYYLDGSRNMLGFSKLLPDCYNGKAHVIDADASEVNFQSDSLAEVKNTSIFIANTDKGVKGVVNQYPGYYESYQMRSTIKEKGKDEFFKEIQKEYGSDTKISNGEIDSIAKYDLPIHIKYNLDLASSKDDIIYINPMFAEGYKKNPFTAAERKYPVEMPYAFDETVSLNMDVPAGYVVDELPKQMRVKYDEEGKSFFEYLITESQGHISFRSRIKFNRAYFSPEEYKGLREFFNLVVKKQNEQIVLKKKK
jgi:hypothetical protein